MTINVENFLDNCGVTKFKKLVKIINTSYTPEDHLEILKTYISDYINVSDTLIDSTVLLAKESVVTIKTKEEQLKNLIHKRNIVKQRLKKILSYTTHKSQEYRLTKESDEELKAEIKKIRGQLVLYRANYRCYVADIKRYERNYKNFKKYLELLKEV